MPTIADLRQRFPKDTAGKTDWALTQEIARANKAAPWDVAQQFGVDVPQEETGVLDSLQRGLGLVASTTGSAMRDAGMLSGIGGALEQFGGGVIERNPAQYNTSADVMASPFSALGEKAMEGIGQFLPGAASLLIPGVGPIGAAALMGGSSLIQNVGETRSRMREKGQNSGEDIARAWAYGVPQAGLDIALGPEAPLIRAFMKPAGKGMTEVAAREVAEKGLLKTVLGAGTTAAVQEAPQEVAQSVLGRMATRDALTGADATEEYLMSGFGGFAGGGAIGAAVGPMTRANASKFVDQIDDARGTLAAPLASLDQLPVKQQAADFLAKVTANDFGSAQALDFAQAQSEALVQDRDVLLEGIAQTEAAAKQAKEQDEADTAAIEDMYAQQDQQQKLVELLAKLKEKTPETVKYEPPSKADVNPAEPVAAPVLGMPGVDFTDSAPLEPARPSLGAQLRLLGLPIEMEQPPPVAPPPPQFDAQDRLRAALHQLQLGRAGIPQASDVVAQEQLNPLQQLATDLQKISGFTPEEGFGDLAGTVPGSPLLTKEGRARVLPRPIQPMVLEDLAVDLTQRIDNAVAAKELAPETGAQLKDDVAGLDTPDYNKFKSVRTKFEALREATDGTNRPATSPVPESPPQGRPVVGGSVDAAGTTGSQPDAGVQPRTSAGLVARNKPIVSVAPVVAETVTPPSPEEATNAVQVESPAEVPVRQEASASEGVRGEDTLNEVPAQESQAAETEVAPSLDGVIVDRVYEVEGKKIKMKVDAGKAVADMDTQISLLKQLISCLA